MSERHIFSHFGTLAGIPLYLEVTRGGILVLVLDDRGPRGANYSKRIPIGNPEVLRWLIDALQEWLGEESANDLSN